MDFMDINSQHLSPSSIWYYALHDDINKLSSLLSHSGTSVDESDENYNNNKNNIFVKRSALHYAAHGGSHACLSYLLKCGANPNVRDSSGKTPLHYASLRGSLPCMKSLLENGADVNAKDNEFSSPIHSAALLESSEPLFFLISKGAEVTSKNFYGDTPLHFASAHGSLDCLSLLLSLRVVDVNARDEEGVTPLHQAAFNGHVNTVALLLNHGARVDCKDNSGQSPLHMSSSRGHVECVNYLVRNGEFVNVVDHQGVSPLHQAAFNGNDKCVRALLELGAKVGMKEIMGETALHKAAFNGHLLSCILLFNYGSDVNALDNRNATPLHLASFNGHVKCVDYFIENQAFINVQDSEGESPLHYAALNGHAECVSKLLKNGADVNMLDNEGFSPLHKASFNGHFKVIKILLKYGSKINAKDSQGGTALHSAAYNGHYESVFVLVKSGININSVDSHGCTALHLACSVGSITCVEVLLTMGADTCIENKTGTTPLHYALKKKHDSIVKYLLKKGIKFSNKDSPALLRIFGTLNYDEILQIVNSKEDNMELEERKNVDEKEAERANQKKAIINEAIAMFSRKPEKALDFLVEKEIIQKEPNNVATFLKKTNDLDKLKIGEYLGERDDFNILVLQEFSNLFNFADCEIDQALRAYLKTFRLPGESQKIGRMMQSFADRFYSQNPTGTFASASAAFQFAFSMMLLQTDAHNPNVKNKMTKQQFYRNNSKINEGQDFPLEFQENIYDIVIHYGFNILDSPSPSVSSVSSSLSPSPARDPPFADATKKGWLTKQGGRIKTWKRRWFVLSDNCLLYFKNPGETEPCGIIPLEITAANVNETKRPHCFVIQSDNVNNNDKKGTLVNNSNNNNFGNIAMMRLKAVKAGPDGSMVPANHLVIHISATGLQDMNSWMAAINRALNKN